MTSEQILILIAVLTGIPLLLAILRRREGIIHRLRQIIILEGVYLGLALILLRSGQTPLVSILAGLVAAFVIKSYLRPRSRYIPAGVKRRARAKFELETGEKFNPRKHEYDHQVPFSRGGSHTKDNVRAVEREKNRSKGDRSAWWDVLGR
jgi:hypothetical protein